MNIHQISLNSKDIVVIIKLTFSPIQGTWTYQSLGETLGLSPSQIHASVRRLLASGLLLGKGLQGRVDREALGKFILHGARYVFPPVFGKVVRGIPTGASSDLFQSRPKGLEDNLPTVWPFPGGETRGTGLAPIHSCVPGAILRDPALYKALVYFDALRMGQEPEREAAEAFFRLPSHPLPAPESARTELSRKAPLTHFWKAW
jgi:DNA-binding Lrp family transcriptional regulator